MLSISSGTQNLNAVRMLRGVHPQNRAQSIQHVAETGATDVAVIGGSRLESQLVGDVSKLRQGLASRGLADSQLSTALLTAGALMGVEGFSLQHLAGKLSQTVRSDEKMDELAKKVEHFNDGATTLQADQYQSFGLNVQSALIQNGDVRAKKGQESRVPTALFIAGAHMGYEQGQGGLFQTP